MSVSRNIPLPTARNVQDRPTAAQFGALNYAIQQSQGSTSAALSQLSITQAQYGSFTFSGPPSVTVTFKAPFVDAGYALILSPAITPSSIVKTATDFTVTLDGTAPGYPIDWVAVR